MLYLIVHELVHFHVPHHDDRFSAMMDRHLPKWRHVRQILSSEPLAYSTWEYQGSVTISASGAQEEGQKGHGHVIEKTG